ncbi:MAG: aminoacyl-tRNA hydrolase [Parcubacteria group bacterium CG23_combo_of_CG06-09_8_20_14_all_35_9]|nr:MAG: aminoacyl-tRNA hydrolase [Parcubacteria group bacterium CG23_combo_of_CG06-09_8_20_14_all_35_9]
MTLLIVGLGNPGKTYEKTRHNVGFFTLEILYKKLFGFHNFSEFKEEKKFKALVSKKVPNGIILAKPLTFMNNSGESVNLLTDFYKIPINPENLWVIHDDIDLSLGQYRIQESRGSAGHKGVSSVIEILGTKNFKRVRIGILAPSKGKIPTEDYVLQKFPKDEEKILKKCIEEVVEKLLELLNSYCL